MKKKDIKVYIASPYTIGDQEDNVVRSLAVSHRLINLGYIPFAPLLYHYQHILFPQDYETWMKIDFAWLEACDYLIRLSGESSGADREVVFAKEKGIPVFYSIEELNEYTSKLS